MDLNLTTDLKNEIWRNRTFKLYHDYINKEDLRHVFIVELVALAGFLILMFGYRFIRFAMFVCGFWLSFCIFYTFSPILIRQHYSCDKNKFHAVHITTSFVVGMLVGLFTASLYRFGILLIGKCFGFLLAMLILHSILFQNISNYFVISIFVTILAMVTSGLTWKYEKILMICSTSLVGSFTLFCGIDIFVQSNFSLLVISVLVYLRDAFLITLQHQILHHNSKNFQLPNFHDSLKPANLNPIFTGAWILTTVFGIFFQYYISSKDTLNGGSVCPLPTCCIKLKDEK